MRMKTSAYYSVIQDTTDYCGMGEYLHKHRCIKFEDAKKYLEEHPKCTHIDYFDGEEWHHQVNGEMSPTGA